MNRDTRTTRRSLFQALALLAICIAIVVVDGTGSEPAARNEAAPADTFTVHRVGDSIDLAHEEIRADAARTLHTYELRVHDYSRDFFVDSLVLERGSGGDQLHLVLPNGGTETNVTIAGPTDTIDVDAYDDKPRVDLSRLPDGLYGVHYRSCGLGGFATFRIRTSK